MSGVALIITFVIAIAIMIVAISKWNVHPFLALMGISLLLALVVGLPLKDIPGIIGSGFSGIFSSIGIVIILGALIGTILEKTGAALKLAEMVVRLVGKKHPQLAMEIMGWVVSIPVFCDSGFVILDPIRKALRKKTQFSSVAMTVALSAGLYTSHVLIPPTPGPIAAAGTLGIGDNLFMVIVIGTLISIPSLVIAYFYANYIGKKIKSGEELVEDADEVDYDTLLKSFGNLPNGFLSLAPILVPILCMALGSLSAAMKWQGNLASLSAFIGTPIIALTIGLLFGILLLVLQDALKHFNSMTTETLKVVGPILFITAAGGVLGRVIASAGFVDFMKQNAQVLATVGIFFPFLISAILKTAQGSSTVAITTTAGIMGSIAESSSMMSALGLASPMAAVLTVMAIGAGAMTVSHANDSYFWVVTNFGKLKPEEGYRTQTMVTLLQGIACMIFIWLFSLILL
ncbi:Inner membrane permease YgbN [bioreactor metagenome]|jgi:GntP family gluconate:H+ symporter|uniref:Inner membrane permease YgbN n=1 Tax=bioreactor metagenome TaxID=1076179 RepID=A0A644ZVT2_9ZZZZ